MREMLARLLDWLRRDRLNDELAEELRFHQSHLERDARAAGVSAPDAVWVARRRLGSATRTIEEARDRWSLPGLDQLQHDVRHAVRGLRRSPGFTAAVVITLGLGIGANAAMFGVIDQLMFRPFPYLRDPLTVQRVYLRTPGADRLLTRESFPYTRYLDFRKWTSSFAEYAAFFPTTVAVGSGDASREWPIVAVSASFFDFFDARPALGRYFTAAEDTTPVGARVAVLSYAFWKTEYGGRNVVGVPIQIDNIASTIIGVAPEGFVGVADGSPPAVFLPITTFGGHQSGGSSVDYWLNYRWDWAEMMVRLKPGVMPAQANADLTKAYVRSREAARAIHSFMARRELYRPTAVVGALKTAAGPYPGLEARTLMWVTGIAVIVLLIACANVANLYLARALRRRREIALRLALGVSRRRLAAQAFTESLVLALLGCAIGLAIAQWGGLVLRRLFLPPSAPLNVVTDWRTLGVAAAAALLAGLLTGLAPVLFAGRDDITATLKAGAREGTYHRSRLRSALLVWQGAMSVVLLVGAGLFVRSLDRVSQMSLGYDAEPVLMARWQRRGVEMSVSDRVTLRRRVLETAQAIPGVEHAAWASNVPLQGTSTMPLFVPGIDSVARRGRFTYQTASDDYFNVMGTRILRGRAFTNQDRAGAPRVVIVSTGTARALWPGQDALGMCVRLGADTMPCTTVIGIAEDAVHDPVKDQPLRYYLPMEQFPEEGGSWLVLRMRSRPAAMAEPVRRALQAVMPGQQYVTVEPMTTLLDQKRRSWRVGALMFAAFGVLALVVAAVGLYGVIAYNVTQRMHELGVRMALGARRASLVRLVVGQGLRFALAGVALGSALAFAAAPWVQSLLFQQSARDPAVFGIVGALLVAVALLASTVPAVRATRADPSAVLRAE
jgi:putative ABC transport system permease protein